MQGDGGDQVKMKKFGDFKIFSQMLKEKPEEGSLILPLLVGWATGKPVKKGASKKSKVKKP